MHSEIKPYKIAVSDDLLAELQTKLELTRFPHELNLPPESWSYGTPVKDVKELVEYWKTEFDWRKHEKLLNEKLPQFTANIDTGDSTQGVLKVHFAHIKSSRPHAVPLLVAHGWPGAFFEILKVVDELTEPTDPKHPAFHVIAPSIPGFGFSDPPKAPGFGVRAIANVFNKLMQKLGYEHYVAQGGDWGGSIVRSLAIWHPGSCRGILTNLLYLDHHALLPWNPFKAIKLALGLWGLPGGYSKREITRFQHTVEIHGNAGPAYRKIQGTKPHSLGFAMTDSPAGLLAWLLEKYHDWTDNYPWTKDELLMWTMMYYVPGPTPSFRLYKENNGDAGSEDLDAVGTQWSDVPLGVAMLKGEDVTFPDDFGNMVQPLKYVKRHDRGGHWAAWEVPDLLLEDVWNFFGPVILEDPLLRGT